MERIARARGFSAVITVDLRCLLQTDRMAFIDENNLPGIGAWLQAKGIASPLGYKQRCGFCEYELFVFHPYVPLKQAKKMVHP